MSGRQGILLIVLCLICQASAQVYRHLTQPRAKDFYFSQFLRFGHDSDENQTVSTQSSSEDDDGEGFFARILAKKSDKEQEAYNIQRSLFQRNKTRNNILVRFRDTEELDDGEDDSFFDPFFKWTGHKKKSMYEKSAELKEKAKEKMAEKMAKWNMTGLFQRFYGAQTGISVLEVDHAGMDFMSAWMTILGDEGRHHSLYL